ncbi:MAG: hypothetical protein ACYCWW_04170 [Deltaproteobacteria bacterium]
MSALALALILASADTAPPPGFHFQSTCQARAASDLTRGVWLLDSFWFDEAERAFRAAEANDPGCSLAFWGEALSHDHPLWSPPGPSDIRAGLAAAERALALAHGARERGLAEAALLLYRDAAERGARARAQAYLARMERLHAELPGDLDIACQDALALLGAATPGDPSDALQRRAAAILGEVLQRSPDQPAALHYLIHADDDPAHAKEALSAARRYGQIAPAVPHALHMPSHIYGQLGLWDDVIASNVAAFAAQEAWVAREKLPPAKRGWHEVGFLIYAYLQKGDLGTARALLALMRDGGGGDGYVDEGWHRWRADRLVETDDWPAAAAFEGRPNATLYPDLAPYVHGLAAFHLDQPAPLALAEATLGRIVFGPDDDEERARLAIEQHELSAAKAALEGDGKGARAELALAERASDGPSFGTPPEPIIPPHELAAELLRKLGDAAGARLEIAKALALTPGRARALRLARDLGVGR